MDLPQTLHGQLYLLAYDRKRHRFDFNNLWLLGFALRAAMLTDLFLTGHLQDTEGKACPARGARPGDPVLRAVFDTIGVNAPKSWAWLIAANEEHAPPLVRDQLKGNGWLCAQRRRTLGIIPTGRLGLYDEDMVGGLADRVAQALRNAIAGRPADPRPLALGLLGVLGEMPTVLHIDEHAQHRREVRELTFAAIAPLMGLDEAVESIYDVMRGRGGRDGGGTFVGRAALWRRLWRRLRWLACGAGVWIGCMPLWRSSIFLRPCSRRVRGSRGRWLRRVCGSGCVAVRRRWATGR